MDETGTETWSLAQVKRGQTPPTAGYTQPLGSGLCGVWMCKNACGERDGRGNVRGTGFFFITFIHDIDMTG